jgi:hypothetical protein
LTCSKYWNEVAVYERLRELQGDDIPRLYGTVWLPDFRVTKHTGQDIIKIGENCRWSGIPGILLQCIPNAFRLDELFFEPFPPIPREAFQDIGDEAIRIIHRIIDKDVLNSDVATRNTLVRWNGEKWKVYLIDFGHAVPRKQESEIKWRRKHAMADEEGQIGVDMQYYLNGNRAAGFVYQPSDYRKRLQKQFPVRGLEIYVGLGLQQLIEEWQYEDRLPYLLSGRLLRQRMELIHLFLE